MKDGWNGFSVLHTAASRVGALDLGFVPGEGGLTARQMAARGRDRRSSSCSAPTRSTSRRARFVVYHGTHGDRGAHRADVVLPGAAYTEKSATYVNTEGRVQMATRAVFPPGDAREDWAILRALSDVVGQASALRLARRACARRCTRRYPHFCASARSQPADPRRPGAARRARRRAGQGAVPLAASSDFYLTNPIARARP